MKQLVFLLVIIGLLFAVVHRMSKLPVVHKSVSTEELTLYTHEHPEGMSITEDGLPDKYELVWTK